MKQLTVNKTWFSRPEIKSEYKMLLRMKQRGIYSIPYEIMISNMRKGKRNVMCGELWRLQSAQTKVMPFNWTGTWMRRHGALLEFSCRASPWVSFEIGFRTGFMAPGFGNFSQRSKIGGRNQWRRTVKILFTDEAIYTCTVSTISSTSQNRTVFRYRKNVYANWQNSACSNLEIQKILRRTMPRLPYLKYCTT